MRTTTAILALALLFPTASLPGQEDPHAHHTTGVATPAPAATVPPLPPNEAIPPDAEGAKAAKGPSFVVSGERVLGKTSNAPKT